MLGPRLIAKLVHNSENYGFCYVGDISIVNGIITHLITGGAPPIVGEYG